MKPSFVVVGAVVLAATSAAAQPAQTPPQAPYPPAPYPQQQYPQQPQPYTGQGPYGYGYAPQPQMQVQLTVDEQWLLERGYISPGETIGGGLGALFIGFGVGQAIEGRWSQKGYIFTIGELASIGAIIWGFADVLGCIDAEGSSCNSHEARGEALLWGGLIGISVFRIWEIVDAFAGPGEHNRQLNALRARMGLPPLYSRLHPYIAPNRSGEGGGVAGLGFSF